MAGEAGEQIADRIHVVRDVVMAYREHAGGDDREELYRRVLRLALAARAVERGVVPEVWAVDDPEEDLSLTLRVVRWQWHGIVIGLSAVPLGAPRIGDAQPVAAVVREHMARRGCPEDRARAELRAAAWDARPVDIEVQPEQWRMRSRLTMDDWTLRVQRTGEGPPLIVAAAWRGDSRRK